MDLSWLGLVFKGITTVVSQWIEADEAERKAIEERALKAIVDMISDRNDVGRQHNERTAATLAEIEKALEKFPEPSQNER